MSIYQSDVNEFLHVLEDISANLARIADAAERQADTLDACVLRPGDMQPRIMVGMPGALEVIEL